MLKKSSCELVILLVGVVISLAAAVEKPNTPQKTCVTQECHAEYGKKAHVHGPVSLGDCKSCHKAVDSKEHTWQFVREGKDLCGYCHLDQTAGKNIHEPVKSGNCLQCHDPHSSDNKFLIQKGTVSGLCGSCHETTKKLGFLPRFNNGKQPPDKF